MTKKIKMTELVLRDAHQSLFATRLRLDDMLPIAQIKMSKKTNTKPIPENIRLIPSPISSEGVIIFLPYLFEKIDNFILIDLF